jgi:hypothetical protein
MHSRALQRLALVTGMLGLVVSVTSAAGSAAPDSSRQVVHHLIAGHPMSPGRTYRPASQRLAAAMAAAPNVTSAEHVWLRHQAHDAMARFASTAAPAATSSISGPFDFLGMPLVPAGDLAGNGRQDVLQVRLRATRNLFTASLTARDSLTGRALWTRVGPKAEQEVLPLVVGRFGSPAERGVLVDQLSTQTLSKNSFRMSETIAAWSGRTGKTMWTSAPVTGTETDTRTTASLTDIPELGVAFRATADRRSDVLIPMDTSAFSIALGGPTPPSGGSAKAVLVAGRDGTSSSPYPPLTSTVASPSLQAVADVSGDGLDDVLAITPGKPGSMTAERGDTGATIWTVGQNIAEAGFATPVGRISGGRIGDIAVTGENVSLIRGRDGKVLWTRHSFEEGLALGRVGAGHRVALALVGGIEGGSESSSGRSKETSVVDIRAVTATNRVVWHTRVAAVLRSKHDKNGSSSSDTDIVPVDVQPDGTADFDIRTSVHVGHRRARKAGQVNGRNGDFRAGRFGSPAAGSLVRGNGTDLLRTALSPKGIVLSGYDGATGRLLVHRLVGIPGHARQAFAQGLRATGHGCSDVETGAINGHRHVALDLVSGSGARLWSVRYSLKRLTGGHVVRYKAPQHFCAK